MRLEELNADELAWLARHLPGSAIRTADGARIPMSWVVNEMIREGVTVAVTDNRLRFRPAPSPVLQLTLPDWKDELLAANQAHQADNGLAPRACTECGEVTITKLTKRTKDRRRFMAGPDCRLTPGCPGRHDELVDIPWASSENTSNGGTT